MNRRFLHLTALAATVATLALAAGCTTPSTPKAHIVLVHGAWMGVSSWDKVANELRSRGFAVTAVELPGHGKDNTPAGDLSMAGYVDAVAAKLPADSKAVLVGHSMAGMVISGVAEKSPARISKLVYVAAYLPRSGESLYQLSQTDTDSRVGKYWQQDNPKAYSPATVKREGIVEVFCADCGAADQQWLLDTHKAEAVPPLATPVTLSSANFGSVPRAYVHTLQDNAVSFKLQQTMLSNAGGAGQVFKLDTSHAPMLTQPKALADAIAAAAR
jgi:pimeloyl-ACP methyl ester carboxylesterase